MAKIENKNTGTKSSGLIVEIGPNSNSGTSNIFVALQDQNGDQVGTITGDGSGGVLYSSPSDRRLKQNIKPFTQGLSIVEKIDAHCFEMKNNPEVEHIGFIAQDLFQVLPTIVKGTPETTNEANPMMVDYAKLTPILLAAIKELSNENRTLEKRMSLLESKLESNAVLKERLNSQTKTLETLMSQIEVDKKEECNSTDK